VITLLLLVLALIIMNGLLAGTEAAMISSRKALLEREAGKGSRLAKLALKQTISPTRFLSTVQIGITLIAISSGVLGEAALASRLTQWLTRQITTIPPTTLDFVSRGVVVVSLTYVTLVIGELVPKRLAMLRPEPFLKLMAPVMLVLSLLARPFLGLLSVSTDLALRLFGLRSEDDKPVTEEEIRDLIGVAAEKGILLQTEQELVERVFQLGDKRVSELMTPRTEIDWLDVTESTNLIRVAVATSARSHFPVCKGNLDSLLGVVHVKDLVKMGLLTSEIDLGAIVQKPMFFPESMPALKALETFRRTRIHIAFILDEFGSLQGLITVNDIVEGIFGEMSRAGDEDEPGAIRRADGSWLIDGMMNVGRFKELIEVTTLPKEEDADFQTVGGFVMTALGRVPQAGDRFAWDRFSVEVMDMDRQRVDKVLVTIVAPPAGEQAADDGAI